MTTQTQPDPKPCQLWRDLGDEDVLAVGDRYKKGLESPWWTVVSTSKPFGEPINSLIGSGLHSFQRPVTPGQCDCAGLRKALIDAEIRLGRLYDAQDDLTPRYFHDTPLAKRIREALDQPHTCAGKSAEAGDKFKAFVHNYLSEHGVPEGDPMNQHQIEGCRIGARLDLLFAERDEARRKLADAEEHSSKLERSVWESGRQLAKQSQSPVWRSYVTPPTEQDGVKLGEWPVGFVWAWNFQSHVLSIHAINDPLGPDDRWTHITLPKLPPEPEQDADEAKVLKLAEELAQIEWNGRQTLDTCMDAGRYRMIEMAKAALDFARNQERL